MPSPEFIPSPFSPPEAKERKERLTNVRFSLSEKPGAIGSELRYTNKSFGRKIIILDHGQPTPESGVGYDVEIIRDTLPGEKRGALIVRILTRHGGAPVDPVPTHHPVQQPDEGPVPLTDRQTERVKRPPRPLERDTEAEMVYVLETALPYNPIGGEYVPRAENFSHFTLDQRTLETLEKVATAAELGEPCLLEGETSTSKTSTIEYLAMITNNEVMRLNLNGQTDTSELIGKYVPNDGQLQIAFEQLLTHPELLNTESQAILERANKSGRGLSAVESQQIARNHGIEAPDWRWQDGIDVQAKKKGRWLILDEVNLAEPQILERLNSQLEKNPSMVLSEHDGTSIRRLNAEEYELHKAGKMPGVEPLHPNFRIFGTMNPAEYTGRKPMSPAYKDRWTSYKFVQPPSEKDYQSMMEHLVFGEQPKIEIDGQKYESDTTKPVLNKLKEIPNFRGFLAKMAKFQEIVTGLARRKDIGRSKKESYIFTRRGLLEFMNYLEHKTMIDRKRGEKVSVVDVPEMIIPKGLQYYYLDKISDPVDLQKVIDQLEAIGIAPNKWTHQFR